MCAGHYALDKGCNWCCGDQNPHWTLSRASSLPCGCLSTVGSRVCSPVVKVEASRTISALQCEAGGTGALLLGEEPWTIPSLEPSTGDCALWCHVLPQGSGTKYIHCCSTVLSPTLTMGIQAISRGIPQMQFSQSLQLRSVGSDSLKSGVRTVEAAQTSALSLYACIHKAHSC